MKRSDIQPGMPAVFTRDGSKENVVVVGPAWGPCFSVVLSDGSRLSDVLPRELEKRRFPRARAVHGGTVSFLDVVREFERVAGTQVPRSEVERLMRKADGR